MTQVIGPGKTIGIFGSGQLGRMLALAAKRFAYRVLVFSPAANSPTGGVADIEICADYNDLEAVKNFAKQVDVITLEFENIPASAVEVAAKYAPVRPGLEPLYIAQNRLREKTFLSENGFPVAPFFALRLREDLTESLAQLGDSAILKTAGFGYDGKGQAKIANLAEGQEAWARLGFQEAILEGFVDFERELSVVAARGLDGSFAHYGVIENDHRKHILDLSLAPSQLPGHVVAEAVEICRGIVERLDFVGVLCVEFFLTKNQRLLVNEIAPRPHNSGHLTIEACLSSQFEQQLRAVCALPLGSSEFLRPAAMVNLLGDLWQAKEPDWAKACAMPGVNLHLYGKSEARPGRKMGHITAVAATPHEAKEKALTARRKIIET